MKRIGDLYKLDFVGGKSYIGASTYTAEKRYNIHKKAVLRGSPIPVHEAWRNLGDPKLTILKRGVSEEKLWSLEIKAIVQHGTLLPYGYNAQPGRVFPPGMLGKQQSKKTRKKHSIAIKKFRFVNPVSNETKERQKKAQCDRFDKNPVSAATRLKCSLFQKKRYEDPKEREKTRLATRGIPKTVEHKEKDRLGQLRRFSDPKERQKASLAQLKRYQDNPVSVVTKEKQRQAHLRENLSLETLKRMSQSALHRKKREGK